MRSFPRRRCGIRKKTTWRHCLMMLAHRTHGSCSIGRLTPKRMLMSVPHHFLLATIQTYLYNNLVIAYQMCRVCASATMLFDFLSLVKVLFLFVCLFEGWRQICSRWARGGCCLIILLKEVWNKFNDRMSHHTSHMETF